MDEQPAKPNDGSRATGDVPSARIVRRWYRLPAIVLLQIVLLVACLELGSMLVYPLLADQPYSRSRISKRLAAVPSVAPDFQRELAGVEPVFQSSHVLHPYLGFVNNPAKDSSVNPLGFWGESPLLKKGPDRMNLALFGGSVALQLCQKSGGVLIEELEKSPELAGRKVHLACLAVEGYKQPQQLLALTYLLYLGAEYDVIVNLDGFNEIVLPFADNLPNKVFPYYPRAWNLYSSKALSPARTTELARIIGLKERQESLQRFFSSPLLRMSNFALILWEQLDREIAGRIRRQYRRLVEMGNDERGRNASFGPSIDYSKDWLRYFADGTAQWKHASEQMDALARSKGSRYVHFLQPNQYAPGSKVLSPWEKRHADVDGYPEAKFPYDASVRTYKWSAQNGYPMLIEAGGELRREGVEFVDLTMMFADVRETVYEDACCHFVQEGYDRIAKRIADEILRSDPSRAVPAATAGAAAGSVTDGTGRGSWPQ